MTENEQEKAVLLYSPAVERLVLVLYNPAVERPDGVQCTGKSSEGDRC
jgi:hypothetical protein